MHIRVGTGELCYSAVEFKKLSAPEICRRLGLGDEWVDRERDEQAEREIEASVPQTV